MDRYYYAIIQLEEGVSFLYLAKNTVKESAKEEIKRWLKTNDVPPEGHIFIAEFTVDEHNNLHHMFPGEMTPQRGMQIISQTVESFLTPPTEEELNDLNERLKQMPASFFEKSKENK